MYQKAAQPEAAPHASLIEPKLTAYADADWGNSKDRKSTSGYLIEFGGAVSWGSRRQKCVALSSTESEYVAAAHTVQQVKWIRALLKDLGFPQDQPTTVFEDNQACIKMIENETETQRTKHIDIKYHFLKHEQKNGVVKFVYMPTEDNLADLFTKPLPIPRFKNLCNHIM